MADYFSEMGWRELADELNSLNGEKLPPPASKASVEALIDEKITQDGHQCPVCLKDFLTGDVVKIMPCKHKFHPECLLPWLSKTNSCPLCRYELPTDDEDYEAWKKEKKRAKERETDIENLHNSMFS
ncbi:hypothetical protein GWI33_018146 [Rhynchophorus ferrugineus]|uniref:E3 ubiquitin-protein ligase RNF181 n=1 Tax=Rhynchophorus ferrugineus TaxID=354439 RepID=A0A834I7Y5_RHYFE|nr:hypothetical protein GWI33_018146 [Rhynchophorus ferrugineus]